MEPVAGNPHGGFYEGGRAQEAHSFKARPYPPPGKIENGQNLSKGSMGGQNEVAGAAAAAALAFD